MTSPDETPYTNEELFEGQYGHLRGQVNTLWVAQFGVKHGLSANESLEIARNLGVGVRRTTFLQVYAQIKVNSTYRAAAISTLVTSLPSQTEIGKLPTATARGYVQYADLFVRDKAGGAVYTRHQAIRTDTLMSKESALDFMMSKYRTAIDNAKVRAPAWGTGSDEVVIGAIYVGTHEFSPTGV